MAALIIILMARQRNDKDSHELVNNFTFLRTFEDTCRMLMLPKETFGNHHRHV